MVRAERASTEDVTDADECARRQSIIAAANGLLDEVGLDGLTIRALLKRTGLARRAFYERFDGKDALVLTVFAETLREAAAYFAQEVAALPSPLDQLRTIVLGLVLGSQPEEGAEIGPRRVSAIVREHMRLAQTRPVELESALRPLLAVIAETIGAGIQAGQVRDCDPALQATLIYNLIASTVHIELLMRESGGPAIHRRQRLAEDIWEFCHGAIIARDC